MTPGRVSRDQHFSLHKLVSVGVCAQVARLGFGLPNSAKGVGVGVDN